MSSSLAIHTQHEACEYPCTQHEDLNYDYHNYSPEFTPDIDDDINDNEESQTEQQTAPTTPAEIEEIPVRLSRSGRTIKKPKKWLKDFVSF